MPEKSWRDWIAPAARRPACRYKYEIDYVCPGVLFAVVQATAACVWGILSLAGTEVLYTVYHLQSIPNEVIMLLRIIPLDGEKVLRGLLVGQDWKQRESNEIGGTIENVKYPTQSRKYERFETRSKQPGWCEYQKYGFVRFETIRFVLI